MTRLAVTPPAAPRLATSDPAIEVGLHRIFCVGRNYAAHAREMGADDREPPFFFTKPACAAVASGVTLPYPRATSNLHHEAELVVLIGTGGADIAVADALDHVWGYGAGNDLTRRDLQAEAKEMRRPWDMAKGFDASAVLGPIHPAREIGHPARGRITCHVDGTEAQAGDLSDMIWSVAEIVAHLSRLVTLHPGDLIMTGTPEGVGPVAPGQDCVVAIEGLGEARFRYQP
ncbi:fumarylacetoacetate hydrolase family protein [Limimaricola hongkongensis]|uniref:Fumarylacetoacetate hydrolase family protein n=1 Tax=Limimaricola hongkongensis DSM 17492 TaxID=1122180 RepID=A0A017HE77_9RHOB|nr:fumarylacetoacetate hydrolase family protein [Limimaricola hongkongensis]EYD72600.1 Fumarylacetoacetate hydrolase family protein [Limimaricola hongkongensis DSM 17492]